MLQKLLNRFKSPKAKFDGLLHITDHPSIPESQKRTIGWVMYNGGVPDKTQVWLDLHIHNETTNLREFSCLVGRFHNLPTDPKDMIYVWVIALDETIPEVTNAISELYSDKHDPVLTMRIATAMIDVVREAFKDNERVINVEFLHK